MKFYCKIYYLLVILLFLPLLLSCNNNNKTASVKTWQTPDNYEISKIQPELDKAENFLANKLYDSAFKYYTKTREVYIAEKDSARAGYTSIKMAEIQSISGDYNGSQATAVEALHYLKNSNHEYVTSAYNILGMSYRKLLDYDSAIAIYTKASKITKDSLAYCIIQNNIASAYIDNKKYDIALNILYKLEKSQIVNKQVSAKAVVNNNIGNAYFKLGNPQALPYLKKALHLRETANNPKELLSSYLKLSEFYSGSNKKIAANYAAKAYNLAGKINNNEEKLNALKILTLTTSENKNDDYFRAFFKLNDSLAVVKSNAKNEFAKLKYDSKTTQAENLRLKNQEAKIRLQVQKDGLLKLLLAVAIAILFIIATFIFYIQKGKHKRAKIIEVYNAESRISKKIHDELANDMFDTMMFTETLLFDAFDKKETLLKRLDKVYEKTRDISRENSSVNTGSDYYMILVEMLARYKTQHVNILPANAESVTWDALDEHKKITIYRVLQEFMVNMKKHSHATLVVVKFIVKDKKLYINYADNGIGIHKNSFFYKNGLQNAENRIKSINGTLTFDEVTKGLKISIAIPL